MDDFACDFSWQLIKCSITFILFTQTQNSILITVAIKISPSYIRQHVQISENKTGSNFPYTHCVQKIRN